MEYYGDHWLRIPRRIERNIYLLGFMEGMLARLRQTGQKDKAISLAGEIEIIKTEVEEWLNWAKHYVPAKTSAG